MILPAKVKNKQFSKCACLDVEALSITERIDTPCNFIAHLTHSSFYLWFELILLVLFASAINGSSFKTVLFDQITYIARAGISLDKYNRNKANISYRFAFPLQFPP